MFRKGSDDRAVSRAPTIRAVDFKSADLAPSGRAAGDGEFRPKRRGPSFPQPHFRSFRPARDALFPATRLPSIEGLSPMGDPASILVVFDRLCSQIALALQQSQAHVYTAIALAVVLGLLLFPPKDDPDQI